MSLVVITGASRGFGKAVAAAFAKQLDDTTVHFVVCGRDNHELSLTTEAIQNVKRDNVCHQVVSDLSDMGNLENAVNMTFETMIDSSSIESFICKRIFFVNNAGSLGTLSSVGSKELTLSEMMSNVNLNVTSSCYFTQEFVRRYRSGEAPPTCTELIIVNVSSLAAIQPFATWPLYCAGKAYREMFHKCLSEEIKTYADELKATQHRVIRVLNYAPGPMDTEMMSTITTSETILPETRDYFKTLKETSKLVNPNESADKLVSILLSNSYENGAHIDFYDEM